MEKEILTDMICRIVEAIAETFDISTSDIGAALYDAYYRYMYR